MLEEIYVAFDLMDQGKLAEALVLLDSLEVAEDSPIYYDYLSTYGYVYAEMTDFPHALQAYESYLSKAQADKDREKEHIAHHQLCMVYRLKRDYQQALACLAQERQLIDQYFATDSLVWSVHLYEEGYLYHLLGDNGKAEQLMRPSLEYALQTEDLVAQACAYRGLGEILASKEYLLEARTLFSKMTDKKGVQEIDDLITTLEKGD